MNNYSYSITEKFINKAPENVISCNKIKDYYKNTNCRCVNCTFVNKGTYNSPILHSKNSENILSSIKVQVKGIIDDIIKLQSEKREIDTRLKKLSKKLDNIYLELASDSVEIPMGKLVKSDGKWIIEIEV